MWDKQKFQNWRQRFMDWNREKKRETFDEILHRKQCKITKNGSDLWNEYWDKYPIRIVK